MLFLPLPSLPFLLSRGGADFPRGRGEGRFHCPYTIGTPSQGDPPAPGCGCQWCRPEGLLQSTKPAVKQNRGCGGALSPAPGFFFGGEGPSGGGSRPLQPLGLSHFLVTGRTRKRPRGFQEVTPWRGGRAGRAMAEAEAKMKQFHGAGGAGLDAERGRFPYCVVWTPIPVLT